MAKFGPFLPWERPEINPPYRRKADWAAGRLARSRSNTPE